MNITKHALAAGITLSLLMGAPVWQSGAEAAVVTTQADGRAAFQHDISEIQAVDQRNIIYYMDLTTAEGHSVYEGMISYVSDPVFHAKGSLKSTMEERDKTTQAFLPYYFQEMDDGMVFYRQENGEWEKSTQKDGDLLTLLDGTTEKDLLQNVAHEAKGVKQLAQDGDINVYMVTMDGASILNLMPDLSQGGVNPYVILANTVLQDAGDVNVKVSYDTKRHEVRGIESDLSPALQRVAPRLAKTPLMSDFGKMLKDGKMVVALGSMPSDIMGDISVPQDVVSSAKEAK